MTFPVVHDLLYKYLKKKKKNSLLTISTENVWVLEASYERTNALRIASIDI